MTERLGLRLVTADRRLLDRLVGLHVVEALV
jgi:predicted nucleic acid-binding protein